MSKNIKIIAIGGGEIGGPDNVNGGLLPADTVAIDKRSIELTDKKNPKLLFISTASNDDTSYFETVKMHFTKLGCSEVNVLKVAKESPSIEALRQTVLRHDIVYVGGGNTLRLMNRWRKTALDKVLIEAANMGIVMTGLSAGSICWFTYGNSDSRSFTSGSNQLIKITGLGLIKALHCPHYNTEANRQTDLKRMMKKTPGLVAIALDDCAALEVVGNQYKIITSKDNAKARKTYWSKNKYIVEEIKQSDNYTDIEELLSK